MELKEGEIIEILVENPANLTNSNQPEIGIIVLIFIVLLFMLTIYIKNQH